MSNDIKHLEIGVKHHIIDENRFLIETNEGNLIEVYSPLLKHIIEDMESWGFEKEVHDTYEVDNIVVKQKRLI